MSEEDGGQTHCANHGEDTTPLLLPVLLGATQTGGIVKHLIGECSRQAALSSCVSEANLCRWLYEACRDELLCAPEFLRLISAAEIQLP